MRALLASGVAAGFTACEGVYVTVDDPRLAPANLADGYLRLTLELARHQPSLVEAWLGPGEATAGPRRPAAAIRADIATLLADVERLTTAAAVARALDSAVAASPAPGITETARLGYLSGQVRALDRAAARLLGETAPFAVEALRTLGHAVPPRDGAAVERSRTELSAILPSGDSLAARHAAFRRAAAVPPDRVEAVFRAAVDWCQVAATAHLPLPDGSRVTTRAEDTAGWAAFSRPSGPRSSDLWVARGGGADAAHLLQLAAHEGTPGHHAQHVLAAAALVEARDWTERRLHPAFGPHRLVAEGAAEAGAALLLPDDVRIRLLTDVLLPAAGQPPAMAATLVRVERLAAALDMEVAHIAADYLDTSLGSEDAAARLRDDALVLDPGGMVGFIEKQRIYTLAYPLGRQLVAAALGTGDAHQRWARLATISTTLTLAVDLGE